MSEPLGYSISSELISAMSALNMHPDIKYPKDGYLSEVDSNAAHSYKHLEVSFELCKELVKELSELQREVIKDMPYNHERAKINKMFRAINQRL